MRNHALILAVAACFFAAVAPTLTWTEFCSGSENLNVAAAMEIRRTGRWLIPTLQDQPRIAKPPLTAWTTAALLPRSVLESLGDRDPEAFARAGRMLAWHARWPALVAACLTIIAVGALGTLCGGGATGFAAAAVCATNYAFLRFMRYATTDVHLAMWVAVGALCIALAMLRGRRWLGWTGAGLAMAMGFMSKGPVVLAQTAAPAAALAIWRWRAYRGQAGHPGGPDARAGARRHILPLLAGLAVFVAVALPWFVCVAMRMNAWDLWWREVTREGATDLPPDSPLSYLSIFPMMLPWVVFFAGGLWMGALAIAGRPKTADGPGPHAAPAESRRPEREGLVLAFMLLVVPLLIMSFFRDRNERYLLPMIGAASVLTGAAVADAIRRGRPGSPLDRCAMATHWGIVAGAAIALPVAGAVGVNSQAWLSPAAAAGLASAGGGIVAAGMAIWRRRTSAVIWTTMAVMAIAQAVFVVGYSRTVRGRAETLPLADVIRRECPDAYLHNYTPNRRGPLELSIYLNRTMYVVDNPGDLKPADRPRAIVVLEHIRQGMPPLPGSWRHLGNMRGMKHTWHAYCLPRAGDPPATAPAGAAR